MKRIRLKSRLAAETDTPQSRIADSSVEKMCDHGPMRFQLDVELANERQQILRRKKRFLILAIIYVLGAFPLMLLADNPIGHLTFALVSLCTVGILIGKSVADIYARRRLSRKLAIVEDVKGLGILLDALVACTAIEDKTVENRVIEWLISLQLDDRSHLIPYQRRALYKFLSEDWYWWPIRKRSKSLCLATLQALEQMEDVEAIPHVRRLAIRAKGDILQAAQRCLHALEASSSKFLTSDTLLRPIESDSAAITLLRAGDIPNSNSDQLLHYVSHDQVEEDNS